MSQQHMRADDNAKASGLKLSVIAVIAVFAAAGGGYWLGSNKNVPEASSGTTVPMAEAGKKEHKLLYYRNPMGLPDTSPVPKKDPMGMDYLPVYEGEDDGSDADKSDNAAGLLKISTEKVQKLGVRSEPAERRILGKSMRATGRVEADERRMYTISPKFEGYVERLHVAVTGQPVGRGQALFEVYSPELVSAQREYLIAREGMNSLRSADDSSQDSMRQLTESAKLRLKNWDISEEQIKALSSSRQAKHTLTFRSPVAGIVTEKKAVQGMRFQPGDALYQIAELSSIWVIADIAEQYIAQIKTGAKTNVRIDAYPDKTFTGKVSYIYPTLKPETRTVQVRIELANPGLLLKPGMFAQVELSSGNANPVLTVPASALIDSGTRRIVLVREGEGRFQPHEVKVGTRSADYIEIISGVKEGEQVVVAANFLIDAESNLKAALSGLGNGDASGSEKKPSGTRVSHEGTGSVTSIDAAAGTVTLSHNPVASLSWPAMTMPFKVATPALLTDLKLGTSVAFEFVERQPGDWVVTKITPQSGAQNSEGKMTTHNMHDMKDMKGMDHSQHMEHMQQQLEKAERSHNH